MELYLFSFLVTAFCGDFFLSVINMTVKNFFRAGHVSKPLFKASEIEAQIDQSIYLVRKMNWIDENTVNMIIKAFLTVLSFLW